MYIKASIIRWSRKDGPDKYLLRDSHGNTLEFLSYFNQGYFRAENILRIKNNEALALPGQKPLWAELAVKVGATDGLKEASWLTTSCGGDSSQDYFVPMECDALTRTLEAAKIFTASPKRLSLIAPLQTHSAAREDFVWVLDLTTVQPRLVKTPVILQDNIITVGDTKILIEETAAPLPPQTDRPITPTL